MSNTETGGPAFPYPDFGEQGMTLRDYIAISVLPAVLAHWAECVMEDQRSEGDITITGLTLTGNEEGSPIGIANDAYTIADAMLKARG
jgi:hypothetical protein